MQGFEEQFGTGDTTLAAYLITCGVAELERVVPILQSDAGRGIQFQMHLKPRSGNTLDRLYKEQLRYMNRKTSVEPIAFHGVRRQLLAQMDILKKANAAYNQKDTTNAE